MTYGTETVHGHSQVTAVLGRVGENENDGKSKNTTESSSASSSPPSGVAAFPAAARAADPIGETGSANTDGLWWREGGVWLTDRAKSSASARAASMAAWAEDKDGGTAAPQPCWGGEVGDDIRAVASFQSLGDRSLDGWRMPPPSMDRRFTLIVGESGSVASSGGTSTGTRGVGTTPALPLMGDDIAAAAAAESAARSAARYAAALLRVCDTAPGDTP